ncbi:hypothetical protein C8R45DRAFT_293805 [Mycena sanguinolenta]|nr:hypothetical protein C8R45DRAFT_293805 [Mycena sanguinolenta]
MATMAMALVDFPTPQDALRYPEKWNSDWEALLRRELAFPIGPHLLFQRKMMEIAMIPMGLQGSLVSYPSWVANTCAIQRNITEEALRYFSESSLETRWMDAGPDARGKHILDAMVSLCSKARNLNEARSYCPELSLTALQADGKVFLDLLRSVMLEDASFIPTEPKFVSHPGWDAWSAEQDKINDSELNKMSCAEILILRTKLISHVVQFTLRSFFGLSPPTFIVGREHKPDQKSNAPRLPPVLTELFGGPQAVMARLKDDKVATKARHSQRLGQCCYLGCTKTEPPDGSVKFSRCKSCFEKMRQQVLYCSRSVFHDPAFRFLNHLLEHARRQTGSSVTRLYAVRPWISGQSRGLWKIPFLP